MEKVKVLLKYQKKIIEGLFVCLVGGWAFSSITRGVFTKIGDLKYCGETNLVVAICAMLIGVVVLAGLYFFYDNIARIFMFALVYIFTILCAYNAYDVQWNSSSNNAIGKACFQVVLCFITVLAFIYVREDIFQLFRKIKITKKITNIIIILLGIALFVFVGRVTVLRYLTYSNSTFDFGIFSQMYEYMKQTGMPNTTLERNYLLSHFGVHFSPIFYVALPIYFVFSSPVTVQLIQAVMIALPVIPIVLLCRHYKMSNWLSVALSFIYILYPATSGGAFYDIHENCFLTFFILMTVWAIEKKKNILIGVFGILTLFVKEDAAIYLLVLGAYFLFSKRDKKRGLILMVVSAIYFVVAIAVVNSFGLGILDSRFSNLYFDSEGGLGQIIWTIFLNPAYALSQVITNSSIEDYDKIEYLIYMLVPIAAALFTTGKKYSRYILISPFIVLNVLTTYVYLHSLTFQYNFGVIALFMYMMIMNLADVKVKKAKTLACVSVICASLMFVGTVFPRIGYYSSNYATNKETYRQLDDAMNMIPKDASVCASGFLTPHLWNHLNLYDQSHLQEDIYTDYLVIDIRYGDSPEEFRNILATGKYESVYKVDGIIEIYKKTIQ